MDEERRKAEKSATDMPHFIQSSKKGGEQENKLGTRAFIDIIKLCIESWISHFANFKKLVNFILKHRAQDLDRVVKWPENASYMSNYCVDTFITAIYQLICYRMWRDMTSSLTSRKDELSPPFGLMIDTTATLSTNQHAAVGIKYVSLSTREVCEKILSVLPCNNKSGEGLIETFKASVSSFNKVIAHLRRTCPWLFEFEKNLQRILALALESCESYSSDGGGGARSKYVSGNQRIKAIDIW